MGQRQRGQAVAGVLAGMATNLSEMRCAATTPV